MFTGPNIVTDGLVLHLDAANTKSLPQSQNYLRATEEFNSGLWGPLPFGSTTIRESNVEVAPNGTLTADKITKTSGTGIRQVSNIFRANTGDITTFGVWAKTDTTTTITLDIGDEGSTTFNLTDQWQYCEIINTRQASFPTNFTDIALPLNVPVYLWGARWYSGSGNKPYYPVGTTNNIINDLSGQGNDGTLVNGPTFDSGNGGSLVFDGVNDYVNCGDILDIGLSNWTVSTWIKSTTHHFGRIVSKNNIGTDGWWLSTTVTGEFAIGIDTVWAPTPIYNYDVAGWINLVGVWNRNGFAVIYANTTSLGNIVNISSKSSTNVQTSFNLRISSRNNNEAFFNGEIPIVQIYNRALTPSEILQNYNAIKGRFGLT